MSDDDQDPPKVPKPATGARAKLGKVPETNAAAELLGKTRDNPSISRFKKLSDGYAQQRRETESALERLTQQARDEHRERRESLERERESLRLQQELVQYQAGLLRGAKAAERRERIIIGLAVLALIVAVIALFA